WVSCTCGEPHTSLSRYWWVTTLPACCARICRSLYSLGVRVTRAPLSITMRAARSIASGPAFTTGSPVEARTCPRMAGRARARGPGARARGPALRGARAGGAAHCRAQAGARPRQKLGHAERLDHVVVGAVLEQA